MHGRLDLPELHPIYQRYRNAPLVSISDAQRKPIPFANWIATIYHGLPRDLLKFSPRPGKYLAFLGRISPEKRLEIAIDVALKAGIPFKMAAKVDVVDGEYFETVIKPRISPPHIEYIGEISEAEKSEFLGDALALLFTIDWPEPFGLAMIESLACGTPVISLQIEDTPCPYFCVSANLTTGRLKIHRTGPMWLATRASVAIPGVLPPVIDGSEILVDGGTLNNLPIDVMSEMRRGPIVAVDVSNDWGFKATIDDIDHRPLRQLLSHARNGTPNISSALVESVEKPRAAVFTGSPSAVKSTKLSGLIAGLQPRLPGVAASAPYQV